MWRYTSRLHSVSHLGLAVGGGGGGRDGASPRYAQQTFVFVNKFSTAENFIRLDESNNQNEPE